MRATRNGSRRHGADLKELATVSARDLKQLWEARRGSPPPATLSARVLSVAVAWDVQAEAQGGEVSAVWRQWQAVMQRRAKGAGAEEAVSGLAAPSTAVGTRLLKIWGGETHEVIVRDDGVVWNGNTYTSLSAVARAMTGTPRNGPRFFGLREDAS